jgi:hypothetical protein
MWSRYAGWFTWVYVESRNREQAEKRIRKLCHGEEPLLVQYGVPRPKHLTIYDAKPGAGKRSWTYIEMGGEWWSRESQWPEPFREAMTTYNGAGIA